MTDSMFGALGFVFNLDSRLNKSMVILRMLHLIALRRKAMRAVSVVVNNSSISQQKQPLACRILQLLACRAALPHMATHINATRVFLKPL